MRLVVKAAVAVAAHAREGQLVHAYVRRDPRTKKPQFSARQRLKIEQHYREIEGMAWASTLAQIGKGRHVAFPGDAALDATEAGIAALLTQADPAAWQPLVRTRIQGAVQDHMTWERTHGVTGTSYLLRQYQRATDPVERARLQALLPMAERGDVVDQLDAPSIEAQLQAGARLRDRDDILRDIEQRYHVNLDEVRRLLHHVPAAARGRKQFDAERAIKIFEDKLRGYSMRAIAERHGISVSVAHEAYTRIATMMRTVATDERRERAESVAVQAWERGQVTKSFGMTDVVQDRLQRAYARHVRAVDLGYPGDFLNDNRHALAELLLSAGAWH